MKSVKILAIETSCDETAIAIAEFSGNKTRPKISVLSNIVSSQIEIHQKFGGVVPNLARREHEKNLAPILLTALKEAKFSNSKFAPSTDGRNIYPPKFSKKTWEGEQIQNSKIQNIEKILEREPELLKQLKKHILSIAPPEIDALAVTHGPGLAPALWVGVNFARALAVLWNKPLIPMNHMSGHFFSAFLQKHGKENFRFPIFPDVKSGSRLPYLKIKMKRRDNFQFPLLGLLVSGGHTELALVKRPWKFAIIGETRDDAAGEAFDKVARILGLEYPGGPEISREAKKLQTTNYKLQTRLPRPMIHSNDFDFSFSGLKTAVLYLTRDLGAKQTKKLRPVIAKEFQDAVVDVLVKKTIRAAKTYKAKTVLLGGGVAANNELRKRLESAIKKEIPNTKYLIPDTSMAGDNALMIALAAYFTGKKKAWNKVHADVNVRLGR